ncbi:MAG: 30S ribosomal protein S8 [Gemmatales bacterium]|nr:30S ribosomal protein S8 [Gemmatales bacterium]MDW7995309.1 30S ribosomal protein S8 [Gemmatales bacterium]
MMTDPIADMLTRIRNALRIEAAFVDMPASREKLGIARVLQDEGFILGFEVGRVRLDEQTGRKEFFPGEKDAKPVLRIFLKYGDQGEKVIRDLQRVSKPGRRIYRGYRELKPVLGGLGIAIVSTSRGIMSDRQARRRRLGGEVLCEVW